jgi:hypothetical protein
MAKAIKRREPATPEELAAEKAFEVEAQIKKGVGAIRAVWVALAAYLHEFHQGKMWEHLDYDKFEDWLGSPEIGLGRSQVYALIETYEELVVKRELEEQRLGELEATKVAVVLPAIRRGEVDMEVALADCAALSRSALREKYGQSVSAERIPLTECEDCGCMKRPKSEAEQNEPIPGQMSAEEANAG